MATIDSPKIVQNIMDHNGWFIDENGEPDFSRVLYIYEYHNTMFHKISLCVCYSDADDIALRTSPAVGHVLMLWSQTGGKRHPIGTLRTKLEEMGVEI